MSDRRPIFSPANLLAHLEAASLGLVDVDEDERLRAVETAEEVKETQSRRWRAHRRPSPGKSRPMRVVAVFGLLALHGPSLIAAALTGPQTTHIFTTPGTKTVTLRVCDKNGQCSSTTKTLTVLDPKPAILQPVVPSKVGSAEPLVTFSAKVTGRPPVTSTWTVTGPQKTSLLKGTPAGWVPDSLGSHQVKLLASSFSGLALAGPLTLTVVPTSFSDVSPTHWAWFSIELLAASGITSGCGSLTFCPDEIVTRAQMAVFLVRAVRGPGFVPLPATGTRFRDVGCRLHRATRC